METLSFWDSILLAACVFLSGFCMYFLVIHFWALRVYVEAKGAQEEGFGKTF